MRRSSPLHPARLVAALLAASLLGCPGCGEDDRPAPRHAVILLVDTLRKDHLRGAGQGATFTPRMDRMAAEWVSFERTQTTCSWTKPTVASLFTGLYPSRHGAIGSEHFFTGRAVLEDSLDTLAERFSAAGFRTAAFVTNPNIVRRYRFDQGFDEFTEPAGDAHDLLERAWAWLETVDRAGDRAFLYLHLIDPHSPYFPPEAYRDRFAVGDAGERAPFAKIGNPFGISLWTQEFRKWRPAGVDDRFRLDEDYIVGHLNRMAPEGAENRYTKDWLRSKLDLGFGGLDDPGLVRRRDYLKSLYRGELAYADAEIGRFTDRMAKTGILGRSVFVLTGDHGEAFHEHVNWGHGETVYVEEAAVPLVFHVPGPEGPIKNVVADPVSLADVFPSVLDLMDLPSPGGLDGRSLVPWMRSSERETPERGPVLTETLRSWGDAVSAVRGDLKVMRVHPRNAKPRYRVFDLMKDPHETDPMTLDEGGAAAASLKTVIENYVAGRRLDLEGGESAPPLPEEEQRRMRELGYF